VYATTIGKKNIRNLIGRSSY